MKYKLNAEIAELAGAFAADGCLQKNYLCFWGNITEDRKYYKNIIVPFFERNFKVKINLHDKKSNSVCGFYICKKEIVSFFSNTLSFPIGSKSYIVEIPKIIFKNKDEKIITSFIRGFADCDGCLNFDKRYGNYKNFKKTHHTYPRIFIGSVSHKIIGQISDLLNKLKIKHTLHISSSKKINEKPSLVITIRGKERLEKWMKIIGFNNPVQVTKYKIWKKYGFVPPNTNIAKREKVLKGEINPYTCYGPVA